jgi:acyl transferase domain-containing protein
LRTIIQGYLQNAYDYSERDAAVLAEYITIYNAVYRGNWDYFTERYKNQVISHLSRERTGLSIRYDEWPGRTLILIPLGHGGISAVDTTTISDRRVVEELRREDDFGVSQRQDMVDLKEREADDAERRAQTEREVIRREEREIDRERQEIAQERQRVEDDQQITDDDRKEIQEELDRREEIADERDRELEERREEVERLDEFAERKIDEAQAEREEIARDQQAAITQDATGGVIGMTIERQTPTVMGRLVRINTASGRELRRSPLDSVHIRTITFVGGKIIAIAGENRGNGAVRLIEINQDNLEMAKQGDDDINIGSLIWVNGNDLYAITIDLATNTCFLGRFNTNLALQAKSAVKIHSDASVTIQQGRLLTQREDGTALILNPMDLTELR